MLITSDRRPVSYECAHVYAPARLIALEGSNTDGSLRWSTADRLAALSRVKAIEINIAGRAGITSGDIRRLAFIDDVVASDKQYRSCDPSRHELFIGISASTR